MVSSPILRFFIITAVASLVLSPFFMNSIARSLSSLKTTIPRASSTRFVATPKRFFQQQQLFPSQLFCKQHSKMSSSASASTNAFLSLIKERRTIYALDKDLKDVTPARIQEIVKEAVKHVPSSFNSQSNRVAILFGAEHDKFWEIVRETLKAIVPAENWKPTEDRVNMFQGGAGSILFFEDQTVVEGMQSKFALYADKFPVWATQSDAMLQHTLWVALEAEGLGANLQHYNPIVDDKVAATWKFPASWKLNAQLVFGGKVADAGEKEFGDVEEKVKVFGA